MRWQFGRPLLAALVVSLASVSASYAGGDCGGCGSSYSGCNSCDTCCSPKIRYKTCYRDVYEEQCVTCYQTVTKTVMQNQCYTVCKPVWEEKVVQQKRCVCKPVWEEKQVTVCCGEWRTEEYCVPGKCVTRKCKLPDTCCVDPCTCKSHRVRGETVCYTEQLPSTTACRKVWVPRTECRTIKVCRNVTEEVCENVTVRCCRYVQETCTRQVPVCVCEKVPVQVKKTVCRKVPYTVAECVCDSGCGHNFLSSLKDRCSGLFHRGGDCCDTCGNYGGGGYGHAAPYGGSLTPAPAPAPKAGAETIKAMPSPAPANPPAVAPGK